MFSGSLDPTHLVCGIHPSGPSESPCLDFAELIVQGELLGGAYYAGDLVIQPDHILTTTERLKILNTHPLFTGVCPICGSVIARADASLYDCPECDD